jgi:hypothetical protein
MSWIGKLTAFTQIIFSVRLKYSSISFICLFFTKRTFEGEVFGFLNPMYSLSKSNNLYKFHYRIMLTYFLLNLTFQLNDLEIPLDYLSITQ